MLVAIDYNRVATEKTEYLVVWYNNKSNNKNRHNKVNNKIRHHEATLELVGDPNDRLLPRGRTGTPLRNNNKNNDEL